MRRKKRSQTCEARKTDQSKGLALIRAVRWDQLHRVHWVGVSDPVQAFMNIRKISGHGRALIYKQTHRGSMLSSKLHSWWWWNSIHSKEEKQDTESSLPGEEANKTRNNLCSRCFHSLRGMSLLITRQELCPGSQKEWREIIQNPETQGQSQ